MTTLPVTIPEGFNVVVKKGDKVAKNDLLAKAPEGMAAPSLDTIIDLTAVFNELPDIVRKYLLKGPGDRIEDGEIIASRGRSFGLKKDQVISHLTGTIVRFDRGEGRLIISRDDVDSSEVASPDILSPIAGSIKVCNNDSIVIASDSDEDIPQESISQAKVKADKEGSGGKVTGTIMTLAPSGSDDSITSNQITRDTIGKILLLPDIEKDAIAKASAIGVAGILGTELSKDLFEYIKDRKIDIPLISIDQAEGKKLVKSKKAITINGSTRSIVYDDEK
jgi:hypothetical protein